MGKRSALLLALCFATCASALLAVVPRAVSSLGEGISQSLTPGSVVSLKGGKDKKFCTDQGNTIACHANAVTGWEKFTISDAGGGSIALKGGKDKKFCTDQGNTIECHANAVSGWEKFTVQVLSQTTASEEATVQAETPPPTQGPAWLGCYEDTETRDFESKVQGNGFTKQKCETACNNCNYAYFALQNNGNECRCSSEAPSYSKKSDDECNNKKGGDWRNAVFKYAKGPCRPSPLTNLALNKPTEQSSVYYHGSDKAVDGKVDTGRDDYKRATHTSWDKPETWWSVDLGDQEHMIAAIRIVPVQHGRNGSRLNPFQVKIGNAYCAQKGGSLDWEIPVDSTADITCTPPLSGSTVKIELPGTGRVLQLLEVEVFAVTVSSRGGGNGTVVGPPITADCYNPKGEGYKGKEYTKMKACKTCVSGIAGPSQCTDCNEGDAFVPWRANATEGSCRKMEPGKMETQRVRNGAETTLAKWGKSITHNVQLTPVYSLVQKGVRRIDLDVECDLEKSMHCLPSGNATKCIVKKRAALKTIPKVMIDGDSILKQSVDDEGFAHLSSEYQVHDFPLAKLHKFASISHVNEACATAIALL